MIFTNYTNFVQILNWKNKCIFGISKFKNTINNDRYGTKLKFVLALLGVTFGFLYFLSGIELWSALQKVTAF